MKIKFLQKCKTMFVRFIINYMILLTVTVCIGIYAYNQSLNSTKRDAIDAGLATLEQSKDLLDTRMKEVESLVMQMVQDTRVQNFLNITKPFTGSDYYRIQEMSRMLIPYKYSNKFIQDTYVYFSSGVLVSPTYATADTSLMYEKVLKYGNLDYNKWHEKLLGKYQHAKYWPAANVTINNQQHNVITCVQSLPIGSFSNYRGAAIVLVKAEEVLKIMRRTNPSDSGWWYIADKEGSIITSSGNYNKEMDSFSHGNIQKGYIEKRIDTQDMILMHTVSSVNGWRYVSALPSKVVTKKVEYIKRMYLWTMLAALLIGVIISLVMAYRSSKPVRQLATRLKGNMDGFNANTGNELDLIEGTISRLLESNSELKTEMKQQVELMRATFFERLLRGGFSRLKDIETARSYMGINLEGAGYVVIVIRIEGFEGEVSEDTLNRLDLARILVNNTIRECFDDNFYSYSMDNDKVVLLLGLEKVDGQEFRIYLCGVFKKVTGILNNEYRIDINIGAGQLCDSLINIRNSFEEAMQALDYNSGCGPGEMVLYQDIHQIGKEYFYPMDIETRLINLVKMGEKAEVLVILDMLQDKNITQAVLNADMAKQLSYEIRGTLIKLKSLIAVADSREEVVLDEMIKRMDAAESTSSMFIQTKKIFGELCDLKNSQKRSHNTKLKERIIRYVEEQYWQEELCLANASIQFNLTEKYFSQFFKEQVGENFSVYLERFRMEHAVIMLKNEEIPVNEIASRTGYTNVNTFYKAFKRVYGVSPSTYRQNLKLK